LNSYGSTLLFLKTNVSEEDIVKKVKLFGEALVSFLRIRKNTRESMAALENSLKNLERAEDVGEISTLLALTVLPERREYNRFAAQLRDCYNQKIETTMPDIASLVSYASESNDFGKWLDRVLNRDLKTGQDDFTEMMESIRKLDIMRFNDIHREFNNRMEAEEKLLQM
jgi:hypothetical protein